MQKCVISHILQQAFYQMYRNCVNYSNGAQTMRTNNLWNITAAELLNETYE